MVMRVWETPVPIPNTTVKTYAAEGTVLATVREKRWLPGAFGIQTHPNGGIAQLGERLLCKQEVKSSNLFISRTGNRQRTLKTEYWSRRQISSDIKAERD